MSDEGRVDEIAQRHAREMESPLLGDNAHYDDISFLLARLRAVEAERDGLKIDLQHQCEANNRNWNYRSDLEVQLTSTQAEARRLALEEAVNDVEVEEELSGPIPLDIAVQCLTPDGATAVLRATVAATKKSIIQRIRARAQTPPTP